MPGDDRIRPLILALGDDPVLQALDRDLGRRYGERFEVVATADPEDTLRRLRDARIRNHPVALVIVDLSTSGALSLLERARALHPDARTVLVIEYGQTDAAVAAIDSAGVDNYVVQPCHPAEDRLYPVLDDLLGGWSSDYVPGFRGVRVLGFRWAPEAHEIRDFLARYQVPYEWLDVESGAEGARVLDASGSNGTTLDVAALPVVILADGTMLHHPTLQQLADALGLHHTPRAQSCDVVIVGAGPAGLAAAVYAASEGLHATVIECHAPGGQAGQSARIENYLGFPGGLSGVDLARRGMAQAKRFGADIVAPVGVTSLEVCGRYRIAHLDDGHDVSAEAVVLACGATYRRLDAEGAAALTNHGIYYGAGNADAPFCAGERIAIVGGGNSAGQAALNFVRYAVRVDLVVREERLGEHMSAYLVDRIEKHPDITVHTGTEVVRCEADDAGWLCAVVMRSGVTGATDRLDVRLLFAFIGADPNTGWLAGTVARDSRGFLLTGADLGDRSFRTADGTRDPYTLETSVPGVFAAGDARHQSMKRVASAVGAGATAVSFVHLYLDR